MNCHLKSQALLRYALKLQLVAREMEEERENLRKILDMQDKESSDVRAKELLHREKINELEAEISKQRDINIALRKSLAECENDNKKLKESLDRLDVGGLPVDQSSIDIAELLCRTVVAEVVRAERDELAARVASLETQLSKDRRDYEKRITELMTAMAHHIQHCTDHK